MTIAPGSRLGPYQIVASIGAGGMGEVYRATDTRLDRAVAIKILPPQLYATPGMRERFEREARAISSLSHPNICSLYDVGHTDGVDYLVMELLEGQSLAERIARGAIPTEQLLRYGREIAGALDKAHRQKIIHRDLKPGNIFLTKSGVKLLDFGLAKFGQSAAVATDAPTAVLQNERPLTAEGSLLGTLPYMSPEQLEGKGVDERSDIFSLGVILYEMAAGKRPFSGSSHASLIASILEHEPQPVTELRPTTPPSLDRLIRACLQKNPDDRVQTAHDVMLQLQWISESSASGERLAAAASGRARATLRYLPWTIAAVALAALMFAVRNRAAVETPVEFAISPPGKNGVFGVFAAISPDGMTVVTPAREAGGDGYALWARDIRSTKWRKLEGSEPGSDQMKPFFSPDGRSIAFFSNRHLRIIDAAGGAARDVCEVAYGVGGAWLDDGTIVFSPSFGMPMHRVSSSGGTAAPVAGFKPIAKEAKQGWPVALPNGKFLFLQQTRLSEPAVIFGAAVSGGGPRRVVEATSLVGYSEPWLLFVRKGTLFAQRFDPDAMAVEGDPAPLADHVANSTVWMHSGSTVTDRTLAYIPAVPHDLEFVWLDREGERLSTVLAAKDIYSATLSPDDSRILYYKEDQLLGDVTVWIYDVSRRIESKLTTLQTTSAAWSPDGKFIAHDAGTGATAGVYVQPADGSVAARRVGTTAGMNEFVGGWLSNAEILVERFVPKTFFDLWRLPIDGSKPSPIIATESNEYDAELSPEGGWLAFTSNRDGRFEVFARNVISGETVRISNEGGSGPEWSRDEIFFVGPNDELYATPYTIHGSSLTPGVPRKLFDLPDQAAYDVTLDGQKILLSTSAGQVGQRQVLHVLVGWRARLERR